MKNFKELSKADFNPDDLKWYTLTIVNLESLVMCCEYVKANDPWHELKKFDRRMKARGTIEHGNHYQILVREGKVQFDNEAIKQLMDEPVRVYTCKFSKEKQK